MKFLGLDVGERRIGVAKADSAIRIAVPEGVIAVNGSEINILVRMVKTYNVDAIIVGMPRNLNGEKTKQSAYTATFVKNLNAALLAARPNNKIIRILYQDESLTSVQARQNLKNKAGGIQKGDVDAEAATLILQDFLENLSQRVLERKRKNIATAAPVKTINYNPTPQKLNSKPPASIQMSPRNSKTKPSTSSSSSQVFSSSKTEPSFTPDTTQTPGRTKPQFAAHKDNSGKKWAVLRAFLISVAVLVLLFLSIKGVYNFLLTPPVKPSSCDASASAVVADSDDNAATANPCALRQISIPEGTSSAEIANLLKENGLIRNTLAFKIYLKLSGNAEKLKSGNYRLLATASAAELTDSLLKGGTAPVTFRFTSLPGDTLNDVKKRLAQVGYSQTEIDAAFAKTYNHPVLVDKPADASLEGYLFGETYEFYIEDSVETIIERMLTELYSVVEKNGLKDKFAKMGLNLHEGIILASVVQKEAGTLGKEDQKTVAQVFLSRLNQGIPLGSDVTVKYALDQVDPERKVYQDNAAALQIDSCYNTRKNAGLPCGPISNPGALVLISTANPTDTSYLYFLTGDDGLMYYSNTESEHNQKIRDFCQKLCAAQL